MSGEGSVVSCPHTTKPKPGTPCSQCLGAPVKRCEMRPDGSVTDGITARPIIPEQTWQAGYRKHARRGGRATARRKGNVAG